MNLYLPEPVDGPDGQSYLVRIYRTGTLARFPSVANTPRPGAVLVLPLFLLGWLLNLTAFRRNWTVAVVPWHNLPGPRHRERVKSKTLAAARAKALRAALTDGAWTPQRR